MSNIFEGLSADHIIGLLSCFCVDEKTEDSGLLDPELQKSFTKCQEIAKSMAETMAECKIPIEVDKFVEILKPQLVDPVIRWMAGDKFGDIISTLDMFEGNIVRVIRRLEELVREMATAANAIGNDELFKKLVEGRSRLRRGIIFSASLYL